MKLKELLEKIENELKLRNYSPKTVKSYLGCLSDYFYYVKNIKKDPDVYLIKKYLLKKQDGGQSSQTINLYLNSIKYFYREIFKSKIPIDIKFSKTSSKLPIVLSRIEVEKIIKILLEIRTLSNYLGRPFAFIQYQSIEKRIEAEKPMRHHVR